MCSRLYEPVRLFICALLVCSWCMGGHMAQLASEYFRAPAVLFNPAPRVAAQGKLFLSTLLGAPLWLANMASLGITRNVLKTFTSKATAGNSIPLRGFWRVLAPRQRGAKAAYEELIEAVVMQPPVPGNGMTTIYAVGGDEYPSSYFNKGSVGYDLHVLPSLARHTVIAAHQIGYLALMPLRQGSAGSGGSGGSSAGKAVSVAVAGAALADGLHFPELKGPIDSESVTLEYAEACLRVYGEWAKRAVIPLAEGGPKTLEQVQTPGVTKKREDEHFARINAEIAAGQGNVVSRAVGGAFSWLWHAIKTHARGEKAK